MKQICLGICPNQAIVNELVKEYNAAKQHSIQFNKIPGPTPRDLFHKVSIENQKYLQKEYIHTLRTMLFDLGFFQNQLGGLFGGSPVEIEGIHGKAPKFVAEMIDELKKSNTDPVLTLKNIVAIAKKPHEDSSSGNYFRKPQIKLFYKIIAEINPDQITSNNLANLKQQLADLKNPPKLSTSDKSEPKQPSSRF